MVLPNTKDFPEVVDIHCVYMNYNHITKVWVIIINQVEGFNHGSEPIFMFNLHAAPGLWAEKVDFGKFHINTCHH